MHPDDLEPGRYRLTADVINPFADLRLYTDWRCWGTWPRTMEVVVYYTGPGAGDLEMVIVSPARNPRSVLLDASFTPYPLRPASNDEGVRERVTALAAAFEPVEGNSPSAENVLRAMLGRRPLTAISLYELVRAGVIDIDTAADFGSRFDRWKDSQED